MYTGEPQNPFTASARPRNPLEKVPLPLVTYVIVALSVFVYLIQMGSELFAGTDIPAMLGMKVNDFIIQGQVWRLITPVLLHGSILHIAFNMYILIRRGSDLEKVMGHGRYLLLYLLSGFAGNVFSFLFSSYNSLGASTAVFGVIAASGVFIYQHIDELINARGMLQEVAMFAAINLALGFVSPQVDNWGHMGGLLGGLMFAWYASPKYVGERGMGYYRIVDVRTGRDVALATIMVLVFFGALAVLRTYLLIGS